MKPGRIGQSRFPIAPAMLGAICVALIASLTSCDPPQPGSPSAHPEPEAVAQASPAPEPAPVVTDPRPTPAGFRQGGRPRGDAPTVVAGPAVTEQDSALRFVSFNLKNWLTMERYSKGKKLPGRMKPDEEKAIVVATILAGNPDVLGVSEIGTRQDLEDLRSRLNASGCNLPHLYHTGGEDETRHLGLLSRFPITDTARPADDDYELSGRAFRIQRGILDATVQAGDRHYRFLGVHFKSKREIEEADQAEMRRNEAHLLRTHIDTILKQDPGLRLIVYGDMNDTRREAPVRAVQGAYNSPGYLTAVRAKDSRGHVWTHHWEYQDIYSRFDYVLVNKLAKQDVDFDASRILDPENWFDGSDHRALLVVFR